MVSLQKVNSSPNITFYYRTSPIIWKDIFHDPMQEGGIAQSYHVVETEILLIERVPAGDRKGHGRIPFCGDTGSHLPTLTMKNRTPRKGDTNREFLPAWLHLDATTTQIPPIIHPCNCHHVSAFQTLLLQGFSQ